MVIIEEKAARKMPGQTSLFVSFPFNNDIIETIKKTSVYAYDKKTFEWELPITELTYLLDNITYFDNIKVKLLETDKHQAADLKTVKTVVNYRTKPFEYQLDGIRYGLTRDRFLLLDEPGLGKTLQLIYLAEELKAQRGLEHCLIICGINSLKSNWKKEIAKHSSLDCRILGEKISKTGSVSYGSVKQRCTELENEIKEFFIITNVETIRSAEFIKAFTKSTNKIDMIAVDEIHKVSSSRSQQGHGLLKLDSKYKVAMTGTPITSSPISIYTPLKWLGANNCTLTAYRNFYCEFGGPFNNILLKYKNLDILKNQVEQISIRRKQDILDLPPKTIIDEVVDMNDEHRTFYENIKKGVKEEADKVELKTANLLSLVTRLRQATVCPSILTTQNIESSKIERAVDLVEQITANGNKVVIFSTFKEPVKRLAELLSDYKPLIATGDVDDKVISESIDKFQNDEEHKVFIATISKIGVGVTLNRANYAIFLDEAWTASDQKQAEDRIYRIGSKNHVFIYRIMCKNTIDERVDNIVKLKKSLSDFVVDNAMDQDTLNILRQYVQEL